MEVPDEIGAVLLESKREEKNYWNRLGYHKAYFSLDRGDGIENDAVDKPMPPEDVFIHKAAVADLYAAFASLPDKQAKRLYAFFFLDMSKTEIAKAEGVNKSQVSRSIGASLGMSMNFEAVTARYVDVRLERKKEVLDAYHAAIHPQPKQPDKQEPGRQKASLGKQKNGIEIGR